MATVKDCAKCHKKNALLNTVDPKVCTACIDAWLKGKPKKIIKK